jgi:hypothetical protein
VARVLSVAGVMLKTFGSSLCPLNIKDITLTTASVENVRTIIGVQE